MKLDLQAAAQPEAGLGQRVQCKLQRTPRVDGHGARVFKPRLRLQPAGALGPRQHAKARRVGQQQHVGGAAQAGQLEWRRVTEDVDCGSVGSVLQEKRADHAHAVLERRAYRAGHQRLAAPLAVQVAPGNAHALDPALAHLVQHMFDG